MNAPSQGKTGTAESGAARAPEESSSRDTLLQDISTVTRERGLPGDQQLPGLIRPVAVPDRSFQWNDATRESFYFLSMEHALRMTQRKTRREFGGSFFGDYAASVKGVKGWGDGDSVITNYIGHPMQGAISGFILIQNDPHGVFEEFNSGKKYWRSRLRAFAWSAAYSTQFEIGPYSEAMFGNVGMKPGTSGYVDLIMTPVGGMGLTVGEDALDKFLVRRFEERGASRNMTRFYRIAFNPTRSFANVLRGKVPWHRDTREMPAAEEILARREMRKSQNSD